MIARTAKTIAYAKITSGKMSTMMIVYATIANRISSDIRKS
ncbi:Uncharacterised protein [Mycobacterium tuberculosis]|nr:Uncharacterised protein [Mycobacterium tuberculosis]CFS67038.1 Uncharacterised protein [Mycobacterium tuberculosis]CKQ92178.1 Uncharacterised protein [Mycobacterium tuberculosis]CNX13802.1 Uncharacterised protein [Mycobacterium tuberculosis]CNZ94196.1 Uncharacterised protein [Mycobacterium tuberculosis]